MVYVAPTGASAGSAGVFITLAADVAVMAPHTSIGAAHPVELGATGGVEKTDETMKTENGERHLQLRRNPSPTNAIATWTGPWPPSRESVAITAEKALDTNVIDLIANDIPDLLKQLDGRDVGDKTLHTADATVVDIPMNAWEKFSQLFLRPEVMFILMLMVIYGIIGELSSPGAILPGVVGAHCADPRAVHVGDPAGEHRRACR